MSSIRFAGRLGAVMVMALAAGVPHARAADGAALFKSSCVACHGANGTGQAVLQAPPIAGQDEAYLLRQLQMFRSKQRGGESPTGAVAGMQAVAQSLPDATALEAVARYVSRLKLPTVKSAPVGADSPLLPGKATFTVCVACHGHTGEGNSALAAPRVNHLPAWYTLSQLQAYRNGARGTGADDKPGQQMRQIARDALADDEAVKIVAEYIATLGTGRR